MYVVICDTLTEQTPSYIHLHKNKCILINDYKYKENISFAINVIFGANFAYLNMWQMY